MVIVAPPVRVAPFRFSPPRSPPGLFSHNFMCVFLSLVMKMVPAVMPAHFFVLKRVKCNFFVIFL